MLKRQIHRARCFVQEAVAPGHRITRNLVQAPAMQEPLSIKGQFTIGSRIEVKPSAGPRLCRKNGTVIGAGYHPKSLRVILDGSKTPITLHVTYVAIVDA